MAIDRAVLLPGQELMERMDGVYDGGGGGGDGGRGGGGRDGDGEEGQEWRREEREVRAEEAGGGVKGEEEGEVQGTGPEAEKTQTHLEGREEDEATTA